MHIPRIIAMLLLAAAGSSGASWAKSDVVDYYGELRDVNGTDLEYAIEHRAGKWVVKASAWDEYLPIIVDQGRGYIRISDEGTGGGTSEVQVALWRLEDDAPLVGIARAVVDQGIPATYSLAFYRKLNGNWLDVTDAVVRSVKPRDFILAAESPNDRISLAAIGARIYYELPRNGTTLSAYLALDEYLINAVCNDDSTFVVSAPAMFHHYCNNLHDRLAGAIRFDWKKPDGAFGPGVPAPVEIMPWNSPDKEEPEKKPAWEVRSGTDNSGKTYAAAHIVQDENRLEFSCSQGGGKIQLLLLGENVQSLKREGGSEVLLNISFATSDNPFRLLLKIWYFGPDRAWTGRLQPDARFLQHFAQARNIEITNSQDQPVASFAARGTANVAKAIGGNCSK